MMHELGVKKTKLANLFLRAVKVGWERRGEVEQNWGVSPPDYNPITESSITDASSYS